MVFLYIIDYTQSAQTIQAPGMGTRDPGLKSYFTVYFMQKIMIIGQK
jgi:hypothetical protein